VIIVDEARGLKGVDERNEKVNTIYMGLRRALAAAFPAQFLCIMIDTNAKISNFAPVLKNDHSSRVAGGEKLFHPWCCIPTIDLELPLPVAVANVEDTVLCDGLKPYRYNRFDILKHSRPMFIFSKIFVSAEIPLPPGGSAAMSSTDCVWLQLMDLANEKLFGMKTTTELDSLNMMAALAGRFCLVPVDRTSKESLVANKMATLQACSVDRKSMVVDYVVEPVLGESFAKFMTSNFEKILHSLSHLMRSGQLSLAGSKGDYGELIAAIVITRAYDLQHPESDRHFSKPVMVQDILSLFQPAEGKLVVTKEGKRDRSKSKDKSKDSSWILRSLVRYLQFTRLSKPLSAVVLAAGFQRCAAFLTVAGTPACDLVIPILLGEQQQGKYGI
jgi:hypothetical protein